MITRRTFASAFVGGVAAGCLTAGSPLRIGIGAYTYHNLSVDDMIGQLQVLQIPEIEMSRGDFMNFAKPPPEKFVDFRRKIDAAGIRCVSYYAPTIKVKADLDGAVRFARILGCSNITGDPADRDILKYVDACMNEERLTFGIHNHYFKGRKFDYESPEDILNAIGSLSNSVGCTLDLGHLVSCGYDTLDAVRKLGPRLKLIHLKDVQAAQGEVNVPLGTGLGKIPEVMKELRHIGFQGLVAFEYEKEGDINDDVRRQVEYARKLA